MYSFDGNQLWPAEGQAFEFKDLAWTGYRSIEMRLGGRISRDQLLDLQSNIIGSNPGPVHPGLCASPKTLKEETYLMVTPIEV